MPANYYIPPGGLPDQLTPLDERAIFTDAYAFIPAISHSDITASLLPFWTYSRAWIIARPLSGFAETFTHYLMEVEPGGGSDHPEQDPEAEGAIFVVGGTGKITIGPNTYEMGPGSFAYIPPAATWSVKAAERLNFHWIRKAYQKVDGLPAPDPIFVADETAVLPGSMPRSQGRWSTTRFVPLDDLRHDMHVTIVTFEPMGRISLLETHVMEHGLYILEGEGDYRLNKDWIRVTPGDYMWLRAFCPQACVARGDGPFRYLLYKDVNRHPALRL